MGLIFRYNLSIDDSKDVLQDCFIQVFRKIEIYEPSKGKFKPWIKSIAIKIALMHLRKKRSLFNNNEAYSNHIERNTNYQLVDTSLEQQELYAMVLMLPEQQRIVFNLFAIEGFSHKEISQKLKIAESYSRTILTRARTTLKQVFKKKMSVK